MVQMRTRGVLATVVTVLFMLPLVLLVIVSSSNMKLSQTAYTAMEAGTKIGYCEEDISQDALSLIGWSGAVGTNGTANFNLTNIGSLGNDTRIADLSGIIESAYAPRFNMIVDMYDEIYPANITPLGYSLLVADKLEFKPLSGTPYLNLTQVNVVISADTLNNVTGVVAPFNNGAVFLNVTLLGRDGRYFLTYPMALDPQMANQPLRLSWANSSISVTFGVVNSTSGMYTVVPSGIGASIVDFSVHHKGGKPEIQTSLEVALSVHGSINKTFNVHSG